MQFDERDLQATSGQLINKYSMGEVCEAKFCVAKFYVPARTPATARMPVPVRLQRHCIWPMRCRPWSDSFRRPQKNLCYLAVLYHTCALRDGVFAEVS